MTVGRQGLWGRPESLGIFPWPNGWGKSWACDWPDTWFYQCRLLPWRSCTFSSKPFALSTFQSVDRGPRSWRPSSGSKFCSSSWAFWEALLGRRPWGCTTFWNPWAKVGASWSLLIARCTCSLSLFCRPWFSSSLLIVDFYNNFLISHLAYVRLLIEDLHLIKFYQISFDILNLKQTKNWSNA